MTSYDIRNLVLRWYDEVWNHRRTSTIDELCSDELRGFVEGVTEPIDKAGFMAYHEALTSAMPDMYVEVEDLLVEPPKVMVNWHTTGTHTGPGLGVPPSDRFVSFRGLTWMEWKDGRLIGGRDCWNRGKLLIELMQVRHGELVRDYDLTPRQAEVALLMADRLSDKGIARELDIRPNTARRHAAAVLRKLGVHSRAAVREVVGGGPLPAPLTAPVAE